MAGHTRDLNTTALTIQIIGLVLWTCCWITDGVLYYVHYSDAELFEPVRNFLIVDAVSFTCTLVNFLIIAFVIYKSARA